MDRGLSIIRHPKIVSSIDVEGGRALRTRRYELNRSEIVKVVFVATTIGTGGAETMLLKLVQRMDKRKFAPAVIVLAERTPLADKLEEAGSPVFALGLRGFIGPLTAVARLRRIVSQLSPDVLQGWMVHGNLAAQIAGLLCRIPVLWGVRHSKLLPGCEKLSVRVLDWMMKYISRLPAHIVYNSEDGRLHHEALGYCRSGSAVIPNGFDLSQFVRDETIRVQHRNSLGISDETIVIGMVARYHPMKDHRTFLEAASILRQQRQDVLFVLVGQGCASTNLELRATISGLGLETAILLLGERSDINTLVNAFDIGALSSASSEGFPNAIGELMACAVPCVVTRVGDSESIVGNTGISVAPRDPRALAQGFTRLIELGGENRKKLGSEARARIVELFSIDSVVRSFEALYLDCKLAKTSTAM